MIFSQKNSDLFQIYSFKRKFQTIFKKFTIGKNIPKIFLIKKKKTLFITFTKIFVEHEIFFKLLNLLP
jgi:hypothetical protein